MSTEYASYLKGNVDWTTNAVKLTTKTGLLPNTELWAKVICHENIATRKLQFYAMLYATGNLGSTEYDYTIRCTSGVANSSSNRKTFTSVLLPEMSGTYDEDKQNFVPNGTKNNYLTYYSLSANSSGVFKPVEIDFVIRKVGPVGIELFKAETTITIQPLPLNESKPELGSCNITAHRDEKQIYGTVEVLCDEYLRPSTGTLYLNKGEADEIQIPVANPVGEIVYSGQNITGYKLTYTIDYEQATRINYTSDTVSFEVFSRPADHIPDAGDVLIDWKGARVKYSTQRKLRVQRVEVSPIESAAPGDVLQLYWSLSPSDAEIQTVTLSSSNTSVATIDDYGRITAVAAGQVSLTVTSTDEYAVIPSTTITFFVRSDSFPTFADNYEYLSAQTTLNITSALNELAEDLGVTLGHSMLMFDMNYTTLKNMQPLLNAINENVKQLCIAAGISHTLPATVPYRNTNQIYHTMVNQWCRKIEAIHDSI